ncbi:TAFII28-domain-containing protein [Rozella allomycis CSF55]|uniref:Transcription initiation factor TFIID subunit 11 n=1 Tax=Rozella allomycis (strain CSF55) TaxID=988480 RepID=A0A4P9YG93_ROZAC|nr:TAFII28-domain-containing protein [Rozella allomycis CSF55]
MQNSGPFAAPISRFPTPSQLPNIPPVKQPEENELEESDEDLNMNSTPDSIKNKQIELKEKMKYLLANMDDDQMKRYEVYRRSGFPKAAIRKFAQGTLNQSANENTIVVLRGIAKVFVGEVIEEAKNVQNEELETGALTPSQIREAYRRLKKKGVINYHNSTASKRIFL